MGASSSVAGANGKSSGAGVLFLVFSRDARVLPTTASVGGAVDWFSASMMTLGDAPSAVGVVGSPMSPMLMEKRCVSGRPL